MEQRNQNKEGKKGGMRIIKREVLLRKINNYIYDSLYPRNLSYNYGYGSMLGLALIIQIITGIILAMYYISAAELAFDSVEKIMREVEYGWLIRYTHANGASMFFIVVYLHIARGIWQGIYETKNGFRIGVIILILMILIAFLGYSLVFGNMSLWGITVITSILSAIPYLGKDLVELIWGGFSVSGITLTRFYSLHYLLPFVLIGLIILHIIYLHEKGGSNPLNLKQMRKSKIEFNKNYTLKDLIGFLFLIIAYIILVSYTPNIFAHTDNYQLADPLITPAHITPEWYLLPYYAILRAIPNKVMGVILMLGSLLGLLALPLKGNRIYNSFISIRYFKPFNNFITKLFFITFLLLIWIGQTPVDHPYSIIGQILTIYYFLYLFILPRLFDLFGFLLIFNNWLK